MPKYFRRSYAKRRTSGGKKAAAPKRRRLGAVSKRRRLQSYDPYFNARGASAAKSAYKGSNLRGSYFGKSDKLRGPHGKAAVDAATGAMGGFRVGKSKRMGSIMKSRKQKILDLIADNQFPVIKDHRLSTVTPQIDWVAGTQFCGGYEMGYTTAEIEAMLAQSNAAQTVNLTAIVAPVNDDLNKNQKMDIYDKTVKFNFKNTCSRTVYLEVHPFEAKTYHNTAVFSAWTYALQSDNMLQTPSSFGSEELITSPGNRPDMSFPDLNVRWSKRKDGVYKISLEPGQETSYTYVQKGGRFDQQKFNVQQGPGNNVDVDYMPGFSSQVLIFARSELVADAADNDVTYGSGHIAINKEEWKSWSAVPYIKPKQASFENSWGSIIEANELDINQYQANNDPYEEQV